MTTEISSQPSAKNGLVLYIEDNPANMKLVQVFLKSRTDYRLLSASDPMEGLALAKSEIPNLILLDINLPEMSGYEVMAELQADASTAGIPVVALSANAMPKDVKKGVEAGFKSYLTKPVDLSLLKEHIERYIS